MSNYEFGLREVPSSSLYSLQELSNGLSIVQNTEKLPLELIEKVTINPDLDLICDEQIKAKLQDPSFLFSLCHLTIPPLGDKSFTPNTQRAIQCSLEQCRSLPCAYGRIPYGEGNIGSLIFQKGGLLSGYLYRSSHKKITNAFS